MSASPERAAAPPAANAPLSTQPAAAPAAIAKGALRRLAAARLEPTPEHYARAYAEEAGLQPVEAAALPERARPLIDRLVARAADEPTLRDSLTTALMQGRWDDLDRGLQQGAEAAAAQSQAWATLIERIARGLERGGRHWTAARKKDSLQRVIDGSRRDAARLQQRLRQLIVSWDADQDDEGVEVDVGAAPQVPTADEPVQAIASAESVESGEWPQALDTLHRTVAAALPTDEERARALADELAAQVDELRTQGPTPALLAALQQACERARRLLQYRHHLVDELATLCRELTAGITELAEDDSWARGQAAAMQARLGDELSARTVRATAELLAATRERQQALMGERDRAREALKGLLHRMLDELGGLSEQTGRFSESVGRYAAEIEQADTLESLAGAVRGMVEESRAVQQLVGQAQSRLRAEHDRASELEQRVRDLEGELRRLSDEVSTDALTQVANRRGLMQAFEQQRAQIEREPAPLAVGLLDIDNFKKLNDSLGHAAGDAALQALAEKVRASLRPQDLIARYGGEEFVVLLPATAVAEAQEALTRLQRSLSGSLFLHDTQPVFVTFSAGVTQWRVGETLEQSLQRADEALYEAKRSGKNRTCLA